MSKTPIFSFKKIIFISFISLILILVFSILLNLTIGGLTKNCNFNKSCRTDWDYPPALPDPSTPISYNSNCNLPPQGNSKADIRNRMTALYACSIQNHLEKYKDKKITLENGKTQSELIQQLFETDQIETNWLTYDSGNWKIYSWNPKSDQVFQNENYQVHSDMFAGLMESPGKGSKGMNMSTVIQQAQTLEMILAELEVVIKVGDKFEALNYKHILAITGFETEAQMLDFVLIHNKLLGHKTWQKGSDTRFDSEIRNSTPLLFLQDYQFSNIRDKKSEVKLQDKDPLPEREDLLFGCRKEYSANLKTEINLDKKEIIYFAHPNQNSLSKIKLWFENNDLKYDVKNELNCNEMINC